MRRFFFYARLYFLLVAQYVKTRMQYRFDFFVSNLTMILGNVAGLLSLWIIMRSFPSIAGWKYEELVFIYAFALLAQTPTQICFDNIWGLRFHLNQGTFIKYYFKPISSLFYYLSEMVDLKGIGLLLCGVVAFAWSSARLGIAWTPARVVALPCLLLGSSAIIASLMTIAASFSFWVKDSYSVLAFVGSFRDRSYFPIDIYSVALKFVFTWIIPMGFFAFYPAEFFLRDAPIAWTAFASPLFGAAAFALMVVVWNRGTRAWGGTGS
jgi:ABC-2 type transport system permease protein